MSKNEIKEKILVCLDKILKELNIERKAMLIDAKNFGDFSTNIAMGNKGYDPIELANTIVSKLNFDELYLEKVDVVKPGFINFALKKEIYIQTINDILKAKKNYGKGNNKGRVNVEYVSANPTGFLHIGHARNAALGSTIANILEFSGYEILREYYINDAGNQINVLGKSTFARYMQIWDKKYPMPEDCYGGQDIVWAAKQIYKEYGDKFKSEKLSKAQFEKFKYLAVDLFLKAIASDLGKFGCKFDTWFSEKSLYANDKKVIKETIATKLKDVTYEKDGALWLRTTDFDDDKDRVIIKSDGDYTYLTPDIVYHNSKFVRTGKDSTIIDIFGADHLSYKKRMECAMMTFGYKLENLKIICMQLVRLVKDGQEYKMSKRRGTSFWLRDFVKLVGKDSARFHLLDRTANTKIDFDLNIATTKSNDNAVFLIQYANARIHSLLQKTKLDVKKIVASDYKNESELKLISLLLEFPEVILKSAEKLATNMVTQYLISLAKEFNSWYSNGPKIIGAENEESLLALIKAVSITIENGLRVLGISAPKSM
ncbi:arginine--tRNA ligase [Mycoplasmopsis caviae]|uniref:Arginine--tRNA ligase n=1 Tax=Mycoplasmopsis caviae TaxID=55603 RepID=A0A3P8KLI9_9BACT|nr:arginine--tRNA ligase [Mycoplasmopsis caviae]UUD35656.1 arginine--tRNA ligase [Mycoplasmopsis caviae]VDR41598.1 Arginyl-tRNA synthetase [Mycoplasmopsis caviae]